ncbi:MAG: LVIVD repeat-containing protein [Halobacteriaceae archaeon]
MRRRDVLASTAALLGGVRPTATTAPYTPLGRVSLPGAKEAVLTPDDRYAVVAVTNGFAVIDCTTPSDPRVVAENRRVLADRPHGPLQAIYDVAIEDTTVAVAGPAHGDTTDRLAAVAVYDLSTPAYPDRITDHETTYPIHNCELADGIVYLTANDGAANPLVTVDATTGVELGRWSLADVDPAWLDVAPSLRTLHDVTVQGETAVLAHWDAGTWLLDVTTPHAPATIGHVGGRDPATLASLTPETIATASTELPGNAHYAARDPTGTRLAVGREAWERTLDDDHRGGPGGIDLYDVKDPTAPTHLATIPPPPTPDPTVGGVWTTAHNFELARDRLYAAWYRGGITIHDLSAPTDPDRIAWWRVPDATSFWTTRRGDGWVLATSRRDPPAADGRGAAIYVFPDRAGTQPTAPPLTTPATTRTTTTRTTTTTTRSTTPTAGSTTGTTTPGQPGFGIVTAGAALAYAAYHVLTRD